MHRVRFLLALCGLLLAAQPALAGPMGLPDYAITIEVGGDTLGTYDLPHTYTTSTNGDGGTYLLTGPVTDPEGLYRLDAWSSSYDVDPFVTNNFTVTNISGVPQIFEVIVLSPVLPQGPLTAMSGSVGLTVTNTTGTASATTAGSAIYTALIDLASVQTLLDPVSGASCALAFCSDTVSADFGIPGAVIGPPATTNIGIRIRFELSPGDSAGVTSVFNIEAVPEPMTALMLAGGLVGLAMAGRRRASS